MGAAFSMVWQVLKALPAIFTMIKQAISFWNDMREDRQDSDFKKGVKDKDSSKIEEAFGSDKAGVPVDGVGRIEFDDEKK